MDATWKDPELRAGSCCSICALPGFAVMELKLPSYGHMVEDRGSVL